MKTKAILFGLFAVTLFSVGTTVTLIFNSAPTDHQLISYFFLSLFVSLFGAFFFIQLAINFFRFHATPPWQSTLASGRIAVLLSAFLTLALLLRSYKLWNVATGIVLFVIVVVLDMLWRGRLKLKKEKA
ncbi:MAG TPA: hypothetical protein VLE93_01615 [Candidatus Saccharimonadales bacterium]|nr:hypothetical protein [Candidatus Saccharimonadales bacterium]